MDTTFQEYIEKKRRFIRIAVIFVILFYFSLPLSLIFFPAMMQLKIPVIEISFAWVYAFLQFVMTWLIGWVYFKKASEWDRYIEQLEQE